MMQQAATASVTPAVSQTAARATITFSALGLGLLAILHVLSPEMEPSWRMVSEYALGSYGWVLALMFVSWALSCVMLFIAVRPHIRTTGGKIGLGFLLAAVLGLSMAARFDVSHNLHGLSALIGMPSLPTAAMLISVSLVRNPAWSWARSRLLWTANLTWVSLALMAATVFIGLWLSGGEFGPGVPAGIPNRLMIVSWGAWLITVARLADGMREPTSA